LCPSHDSYHADQLLFDVAVYVCCIQSYTTVRNADDRYDEYVHSRGSCPVTSIAPKPSWQMEKLN
jgi:archaellum component FlaF (FlaF/FlaG flagellin family)